MRPITVHTNCENPEYPTRVRIIDLDGTFEEAEGYNPPEYSFSVKVEIKYNKVVDGKEENLITCSFWTEQDSTQLSYEDDDLDEESVEEWFLEGLSEDLSFHDLEGLEDLDFYALGVPTNKGDEDYGKDMEDAISDALDECIPDKWSRFKYQCSDLYKQQQETVKFKEKEIETINGDCKTVWIISDFDFEEETDEGYDFVNVSYYLECQFYVKDKLLYYVDFKTNPKYFMEPCHRLYTSIVNEIEKRDFDDLVAVDKDMSRLCGSFKDFVGLMEDNETLEDSVFYHIKCKFDLDINKDDEDYDEDEDLSVTLGELAGEWQEDYDQMTEEERQSFLDS